jgi:hypothetical protein
MNDETYRRMSTSEEKILRHLLSAGFPGCDQLIDQLAASSVLILAPGYLDVKVESPISARFLRGSIPSEGEAEDVDGVTIHFIVHTKNGVLKCLEWYKDDGSDVVAMPRPNDIRVYAGN